MKKRVVALFIVIVMLAGPLAACIGASDPPPPPPAQPLHGAEEDVPPEVAEEEEAPPMAPEEAPMAALPETEAAILRFSQGLFREILALGEENPMISPLSAYYALAMVALGAGGETLEEFSALLGRDPEALAADLRDLTRNLSDTAGSTVLNVAGSVWTAEDFDVNPAFHQAMADYFDAMAQSRDFGAQEVVDEINAWVAEQTEGLIEELISSIGRDAVMLLINTLYFSAKWAQHFNPMTVFQGQFFLENGVSVETDFLSARAGTFPVSVTDSYEAVLLPYDDDRLGFLLVRPTGGVSVRDFAERHDLNRILASLESRSDVQIRMPKLDLEYEILLNDILQGLGLGTAFDSAADFSGIGQGDEPLRISNVLQKVRLLVDEEGTEAAAATAIEIERTSIALDLLELTFNTAYLFAIYDLQTGIPLFMGVVDNPL